jgi:hypothetical protein
MWQSGFLFDKWIAVILQAEIMIMRGIDELKMKKQEEELKRFLEQFGKIGELRKRLISILVSVEDVHAELRANGEDAEDIVELAKKIELLLGEFALSQRMADRMIIGLTPRQRKDLIQEIPEIVDIFGWQKKFDENGNLKDGV